MSAILFEEHRLILAAADAFLNALREPQRQPNKIHQLRASLGNQMMRHRTTENEHVLGPFMAVRGFEQLPDVLAHVQTIQQEWLAYSEHVRKWTPQAIEADWDGYAAGTVGYARNSTDNSTEAIGCYFWGNAGGGAGAGGCEATNAQGVYRSCVTNDASLLATMRGLNGDSYLWFWWDANGNCTSIWVSNNSAFEPKVK